MPLPAGETKAGCRQAWLWGIPGAWAVSLFIVAGEWAHGAGHGGWGNALDLARLLAYWAWLRMVWRCSGAGSLVRATLLRASLVGGLVVNALV
jgi:hypothetical protein